MKKIVMLFMLLICAVSLNAQYFTLTPHWLISTKDIAKDYVVITIDSMSAGMLYRNTINYINMTYKNPEEVIRGKSENEFLTFVSHVDNIFTFPSGLYKYTTEVDYFTTISYKDNKIKISFHDIKMFFNSGNRYGIYKFEIVGGALEYRVYTKELVLSERAINQNIKYKIETYFNNKVDEIIRGIKTNNIKNNETW